MTGGWIGGFGSPVFVLAGAGGATTGAGGGGVGSCKTKSAPAEAACSRCQTITAARAAISSTAAPTPRTYQRRAAGAGLRRAGSVVLARDASDAVREPRAFTVAVLRSDLRGPRDEDGGASSPSSRPSSTALRPVGAPPLTSCSRSLSSSPGVW